MSKDQDDQGERDESNSIVKAIVQQLEVRSDGLSFVELAAASGLDPDGREFQTKLWRAMLAFKQATGVQLYKHDGHVVMTSPTEQIAYGKKQIGTGRRRIARGFETVAAAPGRDPTLRAKADRVIHNATRNATQTATELRMREDARRRALLLGEMVIQDVLDAAAKVDAEPESQR